MAKGLNKEFILKKEEIKGIKGKVNFQDSINNLSFQNAKAVCEYDEFHVDIPHNQIIKMTIARLKKESDLNEENKRKLKRNITTIKSLFITHHSF